MSFTAEVEDFIRQSEDRMLTVMRAAINDVVDDAQTPVSKGGRMRVDTNFLRASGRAALNAVPSGPSVKPNDAAPNSYTYDGDAVASVLAKMKLGDTFFFGWTANYVRYRETYDGFLGAALQNWSKYVARRTEQLRMKVMK